MEALDLQAYDDWLAEHMEEIVAQYAGSVVAIVGGRIAKVGETEMEVYRWAREASLPQAPLVLRVPTDRDLRSIL